jgi:salicylate synthetase
MSSMMASVNRQQAATGLISGPFRTVILPNGRDDRRDLAGLVASGMFASYVSYASPGRRWFAGNALAELIMTGEQISWRVGDDEDSVALGRRPLRQFGDLARTLPLRDYKLFGYFAFDLGHMTRGEVPATAPEATLAHLIVPQVEVEWSPGETVVRAVDDQKMESALSILAAPPPPPSGTPAPVDLMSADSRRDYEAAVAAVVDRIRNGYLKKVIISRRVDIPFQVDLPGSYLLGLRHQSPARSFLLDLAGRRCAGFSPETVVEVDANGGVLTQPLAGTRPLRHDLDEDRRLREELEWDVKECYEHVISVRLAAAEMAYVCDPATVSVRNLLDVKERGTVQHLGSAVTGTLRPGLDAWDAVEALFPAVTASGIPKQAALGLIRELEPGPRQIYAGMVGYAGSDGSFDGAVVLRSIFQDKEATWLQAGAGIVSVSDPGSEYEETTNKLRSAAGCLLADDARSGAMITTDDVQAAVHNALVSLGVPDDAIEPGARLRDDLELDSMDIVQVEQDLTNKLGSRIELGEHADLTVGVVCERVHALVA